MDATLSDWLFWGTLAIALAVAFVVALPVNRWLIGRGHGHAVVHGLHEAPRLERRRVRNLVLLGCAAVLVTVTVTTAAAVIVEA